MIGLQGETIEDFYKTMFWLHSRRNYSVTEIDNMIPFEYDITIAQIISEQKKKAISKTQQAMQRR